MSRRHFLEVSAASLTTVSFTGSRCTGKNAIAGTAGAHSTTQTLSDLYREAAQVIFQARPLYATDNGLSEEDVGQRYANRLGDFSPEAEHRLRDRLRQLSSQIRVYRPISKSQTKEETREVMSHLTQFLVGYPDFSVGLADMYSGIIPFPLNQLWGPPLDVIYTLQTSHEIRDEHDALDYIERLGKFDEMLSSVQEKVQSDCGQGWIPPKAIMSATVRALDSLQKPDPSQHSLVKILAKNLEAVVGISNAKRQELVERAVKNVADVVCPAYRTLIERADELLAKARDESGIWAQPNGEQFYEDAIRQLGGSDLSADEVHQLGLSEVERIVGTMDTLLKAQNYSEGTVSERITALRKESRFLYPDTEDGRKQLIDDLNQRIEDITVKMANLSKTVPQQRVEVRPVPVELQESATLGMYWQPSDDGKRPGIFMVNLHDMKNNPKFSLPTLTYHETVPGHHWQISLAMGLRNLPLLRRVAGFNAYYEGWALYAENLVTEMGLYQDDPFGDLGRLQEELFRAARLVVDTGLHHKRWTREKAIQYLVEVTGYSESASVIEVERYMVDPGQALGYKLGMLKMLELRERAKTELGHRFNLAEFHDVILLGGAVPLKILEQRVSNWIVATKNT